MIRLIPNVASCQLALLPESATPSCWKVIRIALTLITFVLCSALLVNADEVPAKDLLIVNEIHSAVWGESTWDQPISSRDEAIKVFDSVLERVESTAAKALVWELRADYFRIIGDHTESRMASRAIYDAYPESSRFPNAVDELIAHSRMLSDYDTILSIAYEQLEQTTESKRVIELTTAVSHALRDMGDWMAARTELVGLIERFPGHSDDIQTALLRLAADASGVANHSTAREILIKTYHALPPEQRTPILYGNLANSCILTGRIDEAVRYHKEAIEHFPLDPHRASHEFSLAILLLDLGEDDQASKHFQAVLDSNATFSGLDKIQEVARTSLQEITARATLIARAPADLDTVDRQFSSRRLILLLFNAVMGIVIGVIAITVWRNRRSQQNLKILL